MNRQNRKTRSLAAMSAPLRFDLADARLSRTLRLASLAATAAEAPRRRTLDFGTLTRPTDPVMAADLREIVNETVLDCIEAGTADVASEFALPIEARALAAWLYLPGEHAEEWISWGMVAGISLADVDAYVDRQFARARRRPGEDFFSRLLASAESAARDSRLPDFVRRLLTEDRRLMNELLTGQLLSLASGTGLEALRSNPAGIDVYVKRSLNALDLSPHCLGHARMLIRSILKVLCARVDRLTILAGGPRDDRPLLLNFKPLD